MPEEIRYQPDEIVLTPVGPCERCGKELWTRSDSGTARGTIIGEINYKPLFQLHMWLVNCQ